MGLRLSKAFPQKRAFITGAASGLGKGLCLRLAKEGWRIAMSDIDEAKLQGAAQEVEAAGGIPSTFMLDVSDEETYQAVVDEVLAEYEGMDVLINNAGVGDGNLLRDYQLKDWKWLIEINLYGVLHGFKFFQPTFSKQKSGHIISIASAAGFTSAPGMSAYNVSKAGVVSLSETMQYELQSDQVSISVVMPTFFKTNVMQHARGEEYVKELAQKMIQESTTSVSDLSKVILEQAGKGAFYIVHPLESKMAWYLKRFAPGLLQGQIMKRFKFPENEEEH